MVEFNNKSRPKTIESKDKKLDTCESAYALYEGWELILNVFISWIFPIKETQGKTHLSDLVKRLIILTPKEMFQRLQIAIAQAKAGNTSKNLLNKIREIIYSLFWAKEITKKVYNNIMNLVKL